MARAIPDEFVPLHVHYRRDRAIRAAGPTAELLFLRSLAFARANRTDGHVEDFDLDELGAGLDAPHTDAASLVRVGLWVAVGNGWLIRSWEKWNPTSASDSGTFGNHKRWHVGRGVVAPDCPHCPQEPDEASPPNRPDDRPRIAPIIGATSGGIAEESRGEGEGEEEENTRPSPAGAVDSEFDAWWQRYPRKVGKGRARTKYRAARKKTSAEELDRGLAALIAASVGAEPRFIPHASTWLEGERWLDEAATPERPRVYVDEADYPGDPDDVDAYRAWYLAAANGDHR